MDVIIVDDEPAGRRTLRELCAAEGDLNVIGEYGDGVAALAAIRASQPQLLFLDVQMDPMNGIELARALHPRELPSLVFVTAYDAYALEAFELCAVDYLLKPFDQRTPRPKIGRRCSPDCWRGSIGTLVKRARRGRACSQSSTAAFMCWRPVPSKCSRRTGITCPSASDSRPITRAAP
jgi:CheY-like chemotaxis protein